MPKRTKLTGGMSKSKSPHVSYRGDTSRSYQNLKRTGEIISNFSPGKMTRLIQRLGLDHNTGLGGLQGGESTDEFYHISEAMFKMFNVDNGVSADLITIDSADKLTYYGDFEVKGDTILADVLEVTDKTIEIGVIASPTDVTADGGGIILKGATDKTILWSNSDDLWHFNQGLDITGNIVLSGTVDGVDIAALNVIVGGVTEAEMDQIENIGSETISATQWGYLGALDQSLIQAASPTFAGLTLTDNLVVGSSTLIPASVKVQLQIGDSNSLYNYQEYQLGLAQDMYWSGTNWTRISGAEAPGMLLISAGGLQYYTGTAGTAGSTFTPTIPLSIAAGAPSNSFVVDSAGNVGFSTNAPDANARVTLDGYGIYLNCDESDSIYSGVPSASTVITGPGGYWAIRSATNHSFNLDVYNAGTEIAAVTVLQDGKFGVNKTPAKDFDVDGEIRASTGILFGTDTAAANTLDDYEEGTWTPAVAVNGATFSYNIQSGVYTKIGDTVFFSMIIVASSAMSGTTGNGLKINGLPYTVGNEYNGAYFTQIYKVDYPAGAVGLTARLISGETSIYPEFPSDDGANTGATGINFDESDVQFRLSGHYQI